MQTQMINNKHQYSVNQVNGKCQVFCGSQLIYQGSGSKVIIQNDRLIVDDECVWKY